MQVTMNRKIIPKTVGRIWAIDTAKRKLKAKTTLCRFCKKCYLKKKSMKSKGIVSYTCKWMKRNNYKKQNNK